MDVQPTEQQQPVSDDNELAKVLAGVDEKTADETDSSADVAAIPSPAMPPVEPITSATIPPLAGSIDLEPIKKQAIEELRPLVDKLNLPPEEKFDIYLLIIRSTDDQTLIDPAHETAKNIADETRRAQALLDIIKEIEFFSNPQPAANPDPSAEAATPQPL